MRLSRDVSLGLAAALGGAGAEPGGQPGPDRGTHRHRGVATAALRAGGGRARGVIVTGALPVAAPVVPAPSAHGGDGAAVARALGVDPDEVLDLSASLNPFAPDLRPLLRRHLDAGALDRYPDDTAARAALAERLGVDPSRLVLTNGGAEAIALMAAETGAGWVEDPEFSLYARHLPALDAVGPRWRSNPHNPSGALAAPSARAAVWDEAFYPLATGRWTRGDAERGAVVVGSLTKLLACPGLRVGYALAPDEQVAAAVEARRPRWSVNGLAAAALPEMLELVDLARWSEELRAARAALVATLEAHGLRPRPSDANWVLVDGADGLRERLARRLVVVRDATSFGLPGVARVAVPGPADLARLAAALEAEA